MNTQIFDVVTTIVAVYGAVVSTILGIRELQKERRRILIVLEHLTWRERAQITIVNAGYRPVTIADISARVYYGWWKWEPIPSCCLFGEKDEGSKKFPVTIKDGESVSFLLSSSLSDTILSGQGKLQVTVYDVAGNKYKKLQVKEHDLKWGRYSKKS